MDGKSVDVKKDKVKKLKELFPEVFSEGKIDQEKLKLTLGEELSLENERYVLNWAGKSEAFKVLQTPTTATLAPCPEESVNFDKTGNVFIEGENLEVLKVLQKAYYGKIKMIYIDPPYNTGNDNFIYPDRFSESKEDYLKRIGEKDEEGYLLKEGLFRKNNKENGHFHSNWLSMMYPRLFLARNLLCEDGVIFVSIDDNEVHNLRLLMNEIFGEENFVASIIWEKAFSPINLKTTFSTSHDYILVYAKNVEKLGVLGLKRTEETNSRYHNPDNDLRGPWSSGDLTVGPEIKEKLYPIILPSGRKVFPTKGRCWVVSERKFSELLKDNRIWFGEYGDNIPRQKRFLSEVKTSVTPITLWTRDIVGDNQESKREIKEIFNGESYFDTPKPVRLMKKLIELITGIESDDIILDFFAGSGTIAHAVLDLNKEDGGNRKFICVQLPEKTEAETEAYKAGYKTIADIAKERIRRAIKQIGKEERPKEIDLGFKVYKLKLSNFKIWRNDVITEEAELKKQMDAFEYPVKPKAKQTNMLWEILLKTGYGLNTVAKEEKIDGAPIYTVNNGEMVVILSEVNSKLIKEIVKQKPAKCLCLDSLFAGNDKLKTNTVLQMKDAGIEFRTI